MRFTVPQFIEHEAKIVGPLTFRQFIFIGIAGAIGFVLYFTLPFFLFLLSAIVIGGLGVALAFLKIGGRELPTVFSNFLKFNLSPKIYIWRKKETPVTVFEKEKPAEGPAKGGRVEGGLESAKATAGEEDELPLKIAEKSQLKKLSIQIETKTK